MSMGMGMDTTTVPVAARPGDFFSPTQQSERQNFIKSLASVIGPE
jgi:hypothetical protein